MATRQAIVSGGGIGGLAAALAMSRAGWAVQLFEQADSFSEVGAGIQLGPNVIKVLHGWGLAKALNSVAAFPENLHVRSAVTGEQLGHLRLGKTIAGRYGAPYVTIHRADLHALLLDALDQTDADLQLDCAVQGFADYPDGVTVQTAHGGEFEAELLIAADGLWSTVRQQLLADGLPRATGHLAYRALVPQGTLPERLRTQNVTVWLGPHMHVVHYPVRRGELLNIVAFVNGDISVDEIATWDHNANAADLDEALQGTPAALRDLIRAVQYWRLWPMRDRPPISGPEQQAQGRIALLGDAAHPMRPYLAQGAGMAIEDAAELGQLLQKVSTQNTFPLLDVPQALQQFAEHRWRRNARVQTRAIRNGEIFHADGAVRLARDMAMKLLGEKLLDMPWLYGGAVKMV
ncbi:MAG: FAD-dependent monooxygenase [Pseudomonadota bacterium]